MAAESVHPVPCVFFVSMRAIARRTVVPARTRMSAASGPSPCPPLRSTAFGPSARRRRACASWSDFARREGLAEEAGGLGQIGRHDVGKRQQRRPHQLDGIGRYQEVAAGRDHDGIDDEKGRLGPGQAFNDGVDRGSFAEHACLDRSYIEVREDGRHLAPDHVGRHGVHGLDAERVLRRDRGDDGGPVDAERREGLEVGLDSRSPRAV